MKSLECHLHIVSVFSPIIQHLKTPLVLSLTQILSFALKQMAAACLNQHSSVSSCFVRTGWEVCVCMVTRFMDKSDCVSFAAPSGRLYQGHHDGCAGGDGFWGQAAKPAAAEQIQLQPAGCGQ